MKQGSKSANSGIDSKVSVYKHSSKRKNIPPAGLESHGHLEEAQRIRYEYNPHLPPVLRSSPDAARTDELPELLRNAAQRALSPDEIKLLSDALRNHEPWLEWSGKREKPWFDVEPVSLHIHERVSTQAILRVLARQDVQRNLFADPQQEYAKAVQFYQHDVDWSNRMILGDSLQVMSSLARRESLAGKVQMIYMDPPYGIKFSSNFQPQLGQRDVSDNVKDLTREPEMVKAYRDTWTLGIHSYLTYLRDRLMMARELLADSGSIFVQMGEENLHRVRCLMDEIFGPNNYCGEITFATTTSLTDNLLSSVVDKLLWYAKDRKQTKYHQLYKSKVAGEAGAAAYTWFLCDDGQLLRLKDSQDLNDGRICTLDHIVSRGASETGSKPIEAFGGHFPPPPNTHWKTNAEGRQRLINANRLVPSGEKSLRYMRFLGDFAAFPFNNVWMDTTTGQFTDEKLFIVQTNTKVIERCIQMTTDPGDLVLDPTCGSGTSAYVAEQWGRRWITIDTSRVALALARQRLMTARFPYFKLRQLTTNDLQRNPKGAWLPDPANKTDEKYTFQCKTVPHITLKSIARNTALDPIFSKHEPILLSRLAELNAALKLISPEQRQKLSAKLAVKQKKEGKKSITDADRRRWVLPSTEWKEWEVPFDTDPDWPGSLQEALVAYRTAWREKMDEVNECIAKNADTEELVDKPETEGKIVRVSGPFTMESVIALEDGPDSPIAGGPEDDLETFEDSGDIEATNAEAYLSKMLRLLKAAGVDFRDNRNVKFAHIVPIKDATLLHAEGEWTSGDEHEKRVAISVGPEIGNVTTFQVEEAVRIANRRGYDDLVFVGFGFDAAAQAAIEEASHPHLRVHMALIRPDVQMSDLLKTQPGSQIFTVFSAPRVALEKLTDGQYVVEAEGMDVYDPVTNTIHPTSRKDIAAWFLDSDYDGRTFCICQAFFPDRSKWAKLAKALGQQGAVEESAFEALSGLKSLPFPKGEHARAAIKMIDPRGNEGLRVVRLQ